MTTNKIQTAIGIFKSKLPEAKGKFRAAVSGANGNIVEIFSEDGLYCTVNVLSGAVKGM